MKKILIFLTVLTSAGFTYAQNAKFGLRIGGALSSQYGKDFETNSIYNHNATEDGRWTPSGGIYINSEFSKYFWFKHDVFYVNRGSTYDTLGQSLKINQHYLDIYPLSPTFHIKGFQIFAGPAINFLAVRTVERIDKNGKKEAHGDTDDRNVIDLGMVAGAEYEFSFGLTLGVRYVRSFSSQFQPVKGVDKVTVSNQVFTFGIGFTFGKGKDDSPVPTMN